MTDARRGSTAYAGIFTVDYSARGGWDPNQDHR
jgi:hypothetical protein